MSSDFMLTADELRQKRARRRRWIVLGVATVALLTLGALLARPVRNGIKGWQARRHAEKANALIEKEHWSDARAEAVTAYQLRTTEPAAVRVVARFLSRTRQPQGLEFWDQLAKLEPLTVDDLRDEAALALVAGEPSRAARAVAALTNGEKATPTPRDWLLAAQVHLQRRANDQAQLAVQKVLTSPTATRREQLQATLLQAQASGGTDPEAARKTQGEVLARLAKFAEDKDDVALDALVLLTQRALGTTDETAPISSADLIARLDQHPLAHAPQKLLAIDLKIKGQPGEKDALIAGAIAQWRNGDAEDVSTLATWLNGKGEHQKVLDAIPIAKAVQSREVFLQYMDALGALDRWSEIKQLLESERFPLDPSMQRMYLARCNTQLGETTAAENNWKRALETAAGDLQKLMTLAPYAEKNGNLEIAEMAYNQAATTAPNLRAAHEGRLRIASSRHETEKMHSILKEMLKNWPNDTAIQNDEAYLRLLLLVDSEPKADSLKTETLKSEGDQELITVAQLAETLVEREPASLPHRTLLALARLKQNRPAEALKVYENIQTPERALTPSALAVHAAVLAANSHPLDAHKEVEQIPQEQLLPEEKALIADL
ncbi:MAG: hypothetical protein ABI946_09775 [Chthoniobacterales bacterium]